MTAEMKLTDLYSRLSTTYSTQPTIVNGSIRVNECVRQMCNRKVKHTRKAEFQMCLDSVVTRWKVASVGAQFAGAVVDGVDMVGCLTDGKNSATDERLNLLERASVVLIRHEV